ncbi:hypothetical protein [Teichococcus vastitatis]|uniref:Uncharacterized protein n=1 Tax=Teichococcus vastitatis TaxID=2307076 RepID=A0ABS9W627_9PROT|nr:hypothetical protein [Pseudoroseomonas vastitatis]MCI0754744.1 hypothetical protein [Pseudoroseomonas vastitatis]
MQLTEIDLEYLAEVLATTATMPLNLARQYRSVLCQAVLRNTDDAWLREVEQHFRPTEEAVHGQVVRLRRGEWLAEEQQFCRALLTSTQPAAA